MAAVKRPTLKVSSGSGLFRNDHFQLAYATNDIERALTLFSDRYGIKEYRRLEGPLQRGGDIRLELAWVGGVMMGVLQATGPGADFYNAVLPSNGFAVRFHHLGYFIQDQAGWDALQKEIEQGGWKVVLRTNAPGFMQGCIIEVPELGHYIEYVFPEAAGIAFFEGVPAS